MIYVHKYVIYFDDMLSWGPPYISRGCAHLLTSAIRNNTSIYMRSAIQTNDLYTFGIHGAVVIIDLINSLMAQI
jgi:hypothetical protein